MKASQTGFTLIEMMTTVVILAILLSVAVPNFRDFLNHSRMTSAANDVLSDFNLARTEAVKRRTPVTLCKSTDGESCETTAAAPFVRWIVFVDDNNDATVDGGEEVLRDREIPNSLTVTPTGEDGGASWRMTYLPNGFPGSMLAPTVTRMTFCNVHGNEVNVGGYSAARGITVSATGRPTVTREVAVIETLGGCP